MKQTIKSDILKLLTVRSTYLWSAVPLFFVLLGSFYLQGYKSGLYDQNYYAQGVINSATVASFFVAIIAVLHMAHEYRYNTITYALTLSNSRSKVLAAKIISVLSYSIIFTFFIVCISLAASALGASMAGHSLPAQDFNALHYFARSIFYCSSFALVGLLITVLVRHLAASLVILFIVPNTIEGILGLLLKDDSKYLPFRALMQVIQGPVSGQPPETYLSPLRSSLVFLIYIIVGWVIAWWLFLRRDAN